MTHSFLNAATSLALGSISPGETSVTKIIYLRIPNAIGIDNIKIGLINNGGIDFTTTTFGIEIHNHIDNNIVPTKYFTGINETGNSNNIHNVSVGNNGNIQSNYVYLNITLPSNHNLNAGVVRFKWFFDYVS